MFGSFSKCHSQNYSKFGLFLKGQKFANAKKHIMLISRTGFKKIIQIQIVEKIENATAM